MKLAAENAELERARERLTLRHKSSSRWARRALKRGYDVMDEGRLPSCAWLWELMLVSHRARDVRLMQAACPAAIGVLHCIGASMTTCQSQGLILLAGAHCLLGHGAACCRLLLLKLASPNCLGPSCTGTKQALDEQLRLGQELKRRVDKVESANGRSGEEGGSSDASTEASDDEAQGEEPRADGISSRARRQLREGALDIIQGE